MKSYINYYWCPTRFLFQMMFVSFISNTTGVTSGAGTSNPSMSFSPVFSEVGVVQIFSFLCGVVQIFSFLCGVVRSLVFYVELCRSLVFYVVLCRSSVFYVVLCRSLVVYVVLFDLQFSMWCCVGLQFSMLCCVDLQFFMWCCVDRCLSFYLQPLCFLSFDLRILITSLVSSNSS